MKITMSIMALTLALSFNSFAEQTRPQTKEMIIGVSEVFVPAGFDSENEAFVVASGFFPNGCYSWSRAEVTDKNEFLHQVKAYADVTQGLCIMVMVPYTQEINLGRLKTGEHKVQFVGGDGTYLEKTLVVE